MIRFIERLENIFMYSTLAFCPNSGLPTIMGSRWGKQARLASHTYLVGGFRRFLILFRETTRELGLVHAAQHLRRERKGLYHCIITSITHAVMIHYICPRIVIRFLGALPIPKRGNLLILLAPASLDLGILALFTTHTPHAKGCYTVFLGPPAHHGYLMEPASYSHLLSAINM